jgi:hypothetical protein
MMKYYLTIALLVCFATPAKATWVCQRVGNTTICSDAMSGQRQTCQRIGNTTICN